MAASGRAVFGWFPRERARLRARAPPDRGAGGRRAGLLHAAATRLRRRTSMRRCTRSPALMLVAALAAAIWLRDGPRIESAAPPAPDAVRDPRIWRLSAASSLMIIGQVGVTSLLVLYLYSERDWTAAHAALALGGVQVGAALARVSAGPLVRRSRRAGRAVSPAGHAGRRAAAGVRGARPCRADGGRRRRDELERAVVHGRGRDLRQAPGRQGDGHPEHGDARGGRGSADRAGRARQCRLVVGSRSSSWA